jgi:hypothetical protein
MRESGWLIENLSSPIQQPSYWIGGNAWSPDYMKAIRFSREVDADKAARGLERQFTLKGQHRVAEHVVSGGEPELSTTPQ